MQSKVSMVMPCYNKVEYIGAMLQSVHDQVWDNIEVILVNDGSTDGTRAVIAEWEPKLIKRGYSVVTVDQENAGCCAAVYNGMLRMTGEYFCLADCDDMLHPEYVSRMAGWLDGHVEHEAAACNYMRFTDSPNDSDGKMAEPGCFPDEARLLENYLLVRTIMTVWIYMIRVHYIKSLKIMGHFCTERRASYEPCFIVPIAAGNGRIKYFHEPLYRFRDSGNGLSQFRSFAHAKSFYEDYFHLDSWMIERLPIDNKEKSRLSKIAKLGQIKELLYHCEKFPDGIDSLHVFVEALVNFLNLTFAPFPEITLKEVEQKGHFTLLNSIENVILGKIPTFKFPKEGNRIVGYGVLGKVGQIRIPQLQGTPFFPTDLWDKSATDREKVCGIRVCQPDVATLSNDDTVLIFPKDETVVAEIQLELDKRNFNNCLYYSDIREIQTACYFQRLTEGIA
ncbi:MAG: glycosyltransferase family 2 protein [Clostridiales Family XIII bacterium]|jgi:glycosyltransferase involved in cell wall biosynthesis|nr:glycosyltransferase family 2 protein [Clostridiales Family XIII bacterium]